MKKVMLHNKLTLCDTYFFKILILLLGVNLGQIIKADATDEWKYTILKPKTMNTSSKILVTNTNKNMFHDAVTADEDACIDYCSRDLLCDGIAFSG